MDYSPYDFDDLSAFTDQSAEGSFTIYFSPPEADHTPSYTFFAEVKIENLTRALEEMALPA